MIIAVIVREDGTDDGVEAGDIYIGDSDFSSTPDDRDVVYQSGEVSLVGSATTASLRDVLPVRAPYAVAEAGDLQLTCNASSGTGDTTLYATIYAEVYG